jgi:PEP-CTERM motif
MTPKTKLSVVPRLDARLTAYAALAGVALTAPAVMKAAVVDSGIINLSVPNTFDGIYFNFLTGASGTTSGSVPGWDWNPYNSGTAVSFFWNGTPANSNSGVAGTTTGPYLNLAPGSLVSAGSVFTAVTASTATTAFQGTGIETLGFRFFNETTSAINYGYVQLSSTATSGFPLTIVRYAYDNAGVPITVVPEPSTVALFGAIATGAVGLRAWRKRKAA